MKKNNLLVAAGAAIIVVGIVVAIIVYRNYPDYTRTAQAIGIVGTIFGGMLITLTIKRKGVGRQF